MKTDLKNKRVLITCGPTWVPIDDMRVISNVSTGELGHILAKDFSLAGARVTLLEGPVVHSLTFKSPRLRVIKFLFFEELQERLERELKKTWDVIIHAAAVSDYRLEKPFTKKISSDKGGIHLSLVPTTKLIDVLKPSVPRATVIGFKLESTGDKRTLVSRAARLLDRGICDFVVANSFRDGYTAHIVGQGNEVLRSVSSKKDLSRALLKIIKG